MKQVLWGVMVSVAPWLLSAAFGVDVTAQQSADGQRTLRVTAMGATDGGVVAYVSDDGDGAAYTVVTGVSNDTGAAGDGRSEQKQHVVRVARVGSEGDETGGWLGVSIGAVSDALSTQLNLNGRGLAIQNIVTDGPADKAGLQVHDVILAIDGKDVATDIGTAVDAIREHAPGEVVNLLVLRNGVNLPIAVTLGSRADLKGPTIVWKEGDGPSAVIEDQVQTRGKFMFKDGDGNWVMKDLGSLDGKLDKLPAGVRAYVPKSGTRTVTVERVDGGGSVRLNVNQDGSTVNIEQDNGGSITVTRTDPQGATTTATYQTPDELKAADTEAFDLYDQSADVNTFTFQLDGPGDLNGVFDLDRHFAWTGDDGDWQQHLDELQAQLEESLKAADGAFQGSMSEARKLLAKLHGQDPADANGAPQVVPFGDKGGHAFTFHPFGSLSKPKHTFESRADGTIEVRIRKGDSELVQIYTNEQDLQRRAPDLYEKYDELMSLDAD